MLFSILLTLNQLVVGSSPTTPKLEKVGISLPFLIAFKLGQEPQLRKQFYGSSEERAESEGILRNELIH